MTGSADLNSNNRRDTEVAGADNTSLDTSAGTSFLLSPDDLKESLRNVVENMGGQPEVDSHLDSFYVKLKDNAADLSPEQANQYADIYTDHGSKHLANHIRDFGNVAVKEAHEKEPVENPKQMDIDLKDYYQRVQSVSNLIFEACNEQGSMEDRRHDGVDAFEDQIEGNGAIALEMYYGMPSALQTPLGRLPIGGSGSGDFSEVMEMLTERLGLIEIVPVKNTNQGPVGPIYQITKDLEGNELPDVVSTKQASYIEYGKAREIWKDVKPEGRRN